MLFDDAQSYTAFKSSCRLSQSVTSHTPEFIYNLVSSAKLTSLDADTSLSVSEITIKNRAQNGSRWDTTQHMVLFTNTPGSRTK